MRQRRGGVKVKNISVISEMIFAQIIAGYSICLFTKLNTSRFH